jgi:hypothetical protein
MKRIIAKVSMLFFNRWYANEYDEPVVFPKWRWQLKWLGERQ